jgi:prolyl 4-hydroxylase
MSTGTTNQVITEELRAWIVAQAEAGCQPDAVLAAMQASGWSEDTAIAAMEATLRDRLVQLGKPVPGDAPLDTPQVPLPEPALQDSHAVVRALDRDVAIVMHMQHPRVVVFGGLLSDQECDALMAEAEPLLARSETVENNTGGSEVNASRTSDGMFFERGQSLLISRIEARIAALLNWPVENGEGLQILRYRPGAEYKPHHDYFDPKHAGSATILKRGGQRVGTLVMYLNTPTRGGGTTFPDVGLEVAPVKGNAVFFSYDKPDVSTRTLHGGAPVLEGVKWVATKWLREGEFI